MVLVNVSLILKLVFQSKLNRLRHFYHRLGQGKCFIASISLTVQCFKVSIENQKIMNKHEWGRKMNFSCKTWVRRSFFCRVKSGPDGINDGTAEYINVHVSGYIRTFPGSQCIPTSLKEGSKIKQEEAPAPTTDQAISAFCGVVRPVKESTTTKR